MITIKLYLDTRASGGGAAPLKVSISSNGKSALLPIGVTLLPSQWDAAKAQVVSHPNRLAMNRHIAMRKMAVETELMRLIDSGHAKGMTATEIKNAVKKALDSDGDEQKCLFVPRLLKFADDHSASTKAMYLHTLSRLRAFDPDCDRSLTFEAMTRDWLTRFDRYLAQTAPSANARNIHLRNIRAVFNDAIDDEVTAAYPFRKFKIRPVPTAKRALTADELRTLIAYPCDDYTAKYRDIFMLIFYLIGINCKDLYNLEEVRHGRIEYIRAKTHRRYSIKVEPEAKAIIERYRGTAKLLYMADRFADHRDWMKKINTALKRIGHTEVLKHGKKRCEPLFPELTTYWARHTWATIAASLDIPKETIAAALGHGGNSVTDIYIDFDRRKVDDANRRVIDFVLNKKGEPKPA